MNKVSAISVPCDGILTESTRTSNFIRKNPKVLKQYMDLQKSYENYKDLLAGKVYFIQCVDRLIVLMFTRKSDNDCLKNKYDIYAIKSCLEMLINISRQENWTVYVQPYLGFEELVVKPRTVKNLVDKFDKSLKFSNKPWEM